MDHVTPQTFPRGLSGRRVGRPCAVSVVLVLAILPGDATGQEVERLRVERQVALGGFDAPEWLTFSHEPGWVEAWPGGGAAFVGADEASIVLVTPSGELVRTFGRRGEGPGEFRVVTSFGVVEDTLWVRNGPEPRLSLFDTAGSHVRTVRSRVSFGEGRFSWPSGISGLLRDGRRWATPMGFEQGRLRSPKPIVVFSALGTAGDTILWRAGFDGLVVERLGVFRFRPFPESPIVRARPQGEGFLVAEWSGRPTVRLSWVDPTGKEERVKMLELPRPPVTERQVTALVDSGVHLAREPYQWAQEQGLPVPADLREAVRAGLDVPNVASPLHDLFVALDGKVWLRTTFEERGGAWLVLDANGGPLWEVSAPDGVRFRAADGMTVWGTWLDDLDVPFVGRFGLQEKDQ